MTSFVFADGGSIKKTNKSQDEPEELYSAIYITDLKGEVFFQGHEKTETGMLVAEGDTLLTKNGRVEVCLSDKNFLWLNQDSEVIFTDFTGFTPKITLLKGSIWIQVDIGAIEVQTRHNEYFYCASEEWYRLDVVKKETKLFRNPRLVDRFDRWVYSRKGRINRSIIRYVPVELVYYRYYWNYYHWGYYPYVLWYWGPWYNRYYRNYYRYGYYRDYVYNKKKATIHKNQLKNRNIPKTIKRTISKKQIKKRTSRKTVSRTKAKKSSTANRQKTSTKTRKKVSNKKSSKSKSSGKSKSRSSKKTRKKK